MSTAVGILVDHDLEPLLGRAIRPTPGAPACDRAQVQPASVDLRLGPVAHRIRAGFLPGRVSVEERVAELATSTVSLEGDGGVLERGLVYLVPLEEELDLPADLRGRFNPRSSTGRCDVFTRVLASGHARFDETPAGFEGRLWIEVAPLSFPIRLRRGDRLAQLRLQRGPCRLTRAELLEAHARTPLSFDGERPLSEEELGAEDDGTIALRVGLEGREPCGWRAARETDVLAFAESGTHDPLAFWDPIRARGARAAGDPSRASGHCVLEPDRFYILASKERIAVPPGFAAEMLPIDVGIGELRNNYAGFFDPGFGWSRSDVAAHERGTPAVLEVRAHDVPFLVEDGQVFFRLRYFRTAGAPSKFYGEGREASSYRRQDLTLARPFREVPSS